jgi:transposase
MAKGNAKGGRPQKLTPEVAERLLLALRGGNYRKVACDYAGISQRTLRYWLQLGRERPKSRYAEFRRQVITAEREAEMAMVGTILRAAKDDPKHAEWWLARKYPDRWAKREEHRIAGPGGGPIQTEAKVGVEVDDRRPPMSDEERARLTLDVLRRSGLVGPDAAGPLDASAVPVVEGGSDSTAVGVPLPPG